jgi:hypothetical protein
MSQSIIDSNARLAVMIGLFVFLIDMALWRAAVDLLPRQGSGFLFNPTHILGWADVC